MEYSSQFILIVSGTAKGPGALELQAAGKRLGVEIDIVAPDSKNTVSDIDKSKHVIYRVGSKSYPRYVNLLDKLEGSKRDVLDRVLQAFDKHDTDTVLSKSSIPVPRSWLLRSGDQFNGNTFVVKILKGNQGRGVELIHSQDELDVFYAKYSNEQEYLAQEYIVEAKGKDKRLFVIGDVVVAAMQRTATTDDFRANLHLGAEGFAYIPTAKEVDMALKSTAAFNLSYGGVDIIDSNRGPLVLEVNPSPGFGISDITGIDIAYELIKNLLVGVKSDD